MKNHLFRVAKKNQRSRRNRQGAVLVELAVTLSLAFFFFFAALEFCRISMIRHTVEHALYEGARHGIVPGATADEIKAVANFGLGTIGLSGAIIDVTPALIQSNTPDVTVRIRLPLDRGLYAPAFFFIGKTLDRSITMQREGVR